MYEFENPIDWKVRFHECHRGTQGTLGTLRGLECEQNRKCDFNNSLYDFVYRFIEFNVQPFQLRVCILTYPVPLLVRKS